METPESTSEAYARLDELSRRCVPGEFEVDEDVRVFAVGVAGDTLTLDDQEVLEAALELDDRARTDDRVTREVVQSVTLTDAFGMRPERVAELRGGDIDRSEEDALRNLRIALAIRLFRVGYPEHFGLEGSAYYSSTAFTQGSRLTQHMMREFLGGVEGQTDGVS